MLRTGVLMYPTTRLFIRVHLFFTRLMSWADDKKVGLVYMPLASVSPKRKKVII